MIVRYLILMCALFSLGVSASEYVIPKKANEVGTYYYFINKKGEVRVCPSSVLKKYFKEYYGCNNTVSPQEFATLKGDTYVRADIKDDQLVIKTK